MKTKALKHRYLEFKLRLIESKLKFINLWDKTDKRDVIGLVQGFFGAILLFILMKEGILL